MFYMMAERFRLLFALPTLLLVGCHAPMKRPSSSTTSASAQALESATTCTPSLSLAAAQAELKSKGIVPESLAWRQLKNGDEKTADWVALSTTPHLVVFQVLVDTATCTARKTTTTPLFAPSSPRARALPCYSANLPQNAFLGGSENEIESLSEEKGAPYLQIHLFQADSCETMAVYPVSFGDGG